MDKITKYQQIIETLLKEYAGIKKSMTPGVRLNTVVDRQHNHFQLISIGWHNNRFVYTIAFHFDIINGKAWIQQNNTDVMIADELMERGIPKSDIVLGFVPEAAREAGGFAVS